MKKPIACAVRTHAVIQCFKIAVQQSGEATVPGFQVISSCQADWLFLDEQSLQVWL